MRFTSFALLALAAIAAQGAVGPDYTLRTRGELAAGVDDAFRFVVPEGTPRISVTVECPMDCDVYLAFNREATRDDFDASGTSSTGTEIFSLSNPGPGAWNVLVVSPTGVATNHETWIVINKDDYVAAETDETTHRMLGVEVEFTAADYEEPRNLRPGRIVYYGDEPAVTPRSMAVYFFNPAVPEATIKFTENCNGNELWMFGMAGTTVEFTVTATQINSGDVVEWTNVKGNPAPAYTNDEAFECDPIHFSIGLRRDYPSPGYQTHLIRTYPSAALIKHLWDTDDISELLGLNAWHCGDRPGPPVDSIDEIIANYHTLTLEEQNELTGDAAFFLPFATDSDNDGSVCDLDEPDRSVVYGIHLTVTSNSSEIIRVVGLDYDGDGIAENYASYGYFDDPVEIECSSSGEEYWVVTEDARGPVTCDFSFAFGGPPQGMNAGSDCHLTYAPSCSDVGRSIFVDVVATDGLSTSESNRLWFRVR